MSLEQRSKKELVEIIHELQEKLVEMKSVEANVTSTASTLKAPGIGLHKDKDGVYHLVYLVFDAETKASAVAKIESLNTKDDAMALYKLKEYTVETIMRKTRGGKYV